MTGGGHFGTDEPGPDHHHSGPGACGIEVGADLLAVVKGAQDMYVGHVRGARKLTWAGPGGDDQTVVVELAAVIASQRASIRIQRLGSTTEEELETEAVQLVRRVMVYALDVPGAGQELFGQRWSIVGAWTSSPTMTTGPA